MTARESRRPSHETAAQLPLGLHPAPSVSATNDTTASAPDPGYCAHGVTHGIRCRHCDRERARAARERRSVGVLPPTAREAGRTLAKPRRGEVEAWVLAALAVHPMTAEELVDAYERAHPGGGVTPQRVRSARATLAKAGKVEPTGARRSTRRGRAAEVWGASAAGRVS